MTFAFLFLFFFFLFPFILFQGPPLGAGSGLIDTTKRAREAKSGFLVEFNASCLSVPLYFHQLFTKCPLLLKSAFSKAAQFAVQDFAGARVLLGVLVFLVVAWLGFFFSPLLHLEKAAQLQCDIKRPEWQRKHLTG